MQTLSANLTTAQKSASRKPYIEIKFLSRNGATERIYKTTDSPRIISFITQVDARDHTNSISTSDGVFSTIIRLRDSDNSINTADFEGYRVYINWGLVTSGGNETAPKPAPPSFVFTKRRISTPQDNFIEFYCISLWEYAKFQYLNKLVTAAPEKYTGNAVMRQIMMDLLGGVFADSIQQDDNGSFTNYTTLAERYNIDGLVLPFPASPVAGEDNFYIGHASLFNRISFDIKTSGAGLTVVAEYWNGSAWTAISTSTDDYSDDAGLVGGLTGSTLAIYSFQTPSDWATRTVNSITDKYWIRGRVSAVGGYTQPEINRIVIGMNLAIGLDTDEVTQGDDFPPYLETQFDDTNAVLGVKLLQYTKLGIITKFNGFHLAFIDSASTTQDYTYDTANLQHIIFENVQSESAVLPNKIVVTDIDTGDLATNVTGEDDLTDSQTAWGIIPTIVEDQSITNTSDADKLAARILDQHFRDRVQGRVFAKINVGQEVWDLVQTNDGRLSNNFDGRVHRITRVFATGVYTIELDLGGYVSGALTTIEDIFRGILGLTPANPILPLPPIPPVLARDLGVLLDALNNIINDPVIGIDFASGSRRRQLAGFLALGGGDEPLLFENAFDVTEFLFGGTEERRLNISVFSSFTGGKVATTIGGLLRLEGDPEEIRLMEAHSRQLRQQQTEQARQNIAQFFLDFQDTDRGIADIRAIPGQRNVLSSFFTPVDIITPPSLPSFSSFFDFSQDDEGDFNVFSPPSTPPSSGGRTPDGTSPGGPGTPADDDFNDSGVPSFGSGGQDFGFAF